MSLQSEAKKTATIILRGAGISYDKLTAKTVSFSDLARAECVFVTVHNWCAAVDTTKLCAAIAREHGFRFSFPVTL